MYHRGDPGQGFLRGDRSEPVQPVRGLRQGMPGRLHPGYDGAKQLEIPAYKRPVSGRLFNGTGVGCGRGSLRGAQAVRIPLLLGHKRALIPWKTGGGENLGGWISGVLEPFYGEKIACRSGARASTKFKK